MHVASQGKRERFIENVDDFRRFMRECREQIEKGFEVSKSTIYAYSVKHATYADFPNEREIAFYFTGNRPGALDALDDGTPAWQTEYQFHKGALGLIMGRTLAKQVLPRIGKDVKVIIPKKGRACLLFFGDDVTVPVREMLSELVTEGESWWARNGLQDWLSERIQQASKLRPTILPPSVINASEEPRSSNEKPETE